MGANPSLKNPIKMVLVQKKRVLRCFVGTRRKTKNWLEKTGGKIAQGKRLLVQFFGGVLRNRGFEKFQGSAVRYKFQISGCPVHCRNIVVLGYVTN